MEHETTAQEPGLWQQLRRVLAWPGCVVIVACHLFWGDAAYSPESHLLASVIGCVVLVTVAYAPPRMSPVVPIFLVYYYVAMARPTFAPPFIRGVRGPIVLSSYSYELALLGAVLFLMSLVVTSRLVRDYGHRIGNKVAPLLDPPEPYGQVHTTVARASAGASLALYMFVNLKPMLIPTSISFAVNLFASPAISLGLLFWDAHRTNKPAAIALFWSTVSFVALFGVSGGVLGAGVVAALAAASLVWTVTGRVPITLVVVGLAVFMVLNPAKVRYRALTWYQERDVGIEERIEAWIDALTYTYSTQTDAAIDAGVEVTAYRTSTLPFVALVFETVPNGVPYAGPKRWLEVPFNFIPRVLWPAKPSHTEAFNNEFTITFGLQTERGVQTTTLNLPSVGDGFWRLGWLGVAIEGALLGMVAGLFQGATLRQSRSLLILATGVTMFTQADKHVFQILASLPQYLFANCLILFMVRTLTQWMGRPAPAIAAKTSALPAPDDNKMHLT